MNFHDYFKAMGEEITKLWKEYDYREDNLPDVTQEYFSKNELHKEINVLELLKFMAKPNDLAPIQSFYNFSDLPINVFKHQKFFIEVLFWSNGTTTTHNHAFSGGFYVVHGQSLNVEYIFHEKEKVNSRFRVGNFTVKVAEHLKTGDYRKIDSGNRLIHTVFHLDRPSVSLVIRTYQNQDALPQLEYRFPHIGLDPDQQDACIVKKFQALSVLRSINDSSFMQLFSDAINECSPDELYWIFRGFDFAKLTDDETKNIYEIVKKSKFGKEILEVVRREKIVRHMVNLRAKTKDPESRMVLACLMNLPNKESIIKYLTEKDQSVNIENEIGRWIKNLADNSFIDDLSDMEISNISASILSSDYNGINQDLLDDPILEPFFR